MCNRIFNGSIQKYMDFIICFLITYFKYLVVCKEKKINYSLSWLILLGYFLIITTNISEVLNQIINAFYL